MRFDELLAAVGDAPLFETGFLLAADATPNDVRRQLSRWVAGGKLVQLRRGLYTLARPYRRVAPHPFLVANKLIIGSYVSLQSALAHHGLIPEQVVAVTSVTHRRGRLVRTALGTFIFQNVKRDFFTGYVAREIEGQRVYVATAEKALADLIHLTPGGDDPAYLRELRLGNLESFDLRRFAQWAKASARVRRSVPHVRSLVAADAEFKPA